MLHLDPAIRDWVLFPIMLVMFLVGLLRHLATYLLKSTPKTNSKSVREKYARFVLRNVYFGSIGH
jgi:hypothetical protein